MRNLIGYLLGGLSSFGNSLVEVLVSGFVHVRSFLTKGGETMRSLMNFFGSLRIWVLNPLMAGVLAFAFAFGIVAHLDAQSLQFVEKGRYPVGEGPDVIEIASDIGWYDTIQMIYNPYSGQLNIVYTRFNESTEGRELWFTSLGEDSVWSSQIGFCYYSQTGKAWPISIAVNPETGQPAVAYRVENRELIFARLVDDVWQSETVYDRGWNCSLAFDPDDNYPAIAFNSEGDWNLYYAKYNGSAWGVRILSWSDACFESLRFHPETGERCISYKTWGWTDPDHPSTLAYYGPEGSGYIDGDPEYVGGGNSLAFDQAGYPHITYFDHSKNYLKHAWWDGEKWNKEVVDQETPTYDKYEGNTSLAISADNEMYVSYCCIGHPYNLGFAYSNGEVWTTEIIADSSGTWSSLVLDDQDRIHIAFIAGGKAWVIADYTAPPLISTVSPDSGSTAGNDTVAISGCNFGDIRGSVTFGGSLAMSITWTGSQIVCVTPPHPEGSVDVVVTADNGKSGTRFSAFTYGRGAVGDVAIRPQRLPPGSKLTAGKIGISAGAFADFAATVTDPAGNPLDEPVAWRVEGDAGIVDENGHFIASERAGDGGALIATAGGVSDTVSVTIIANLLKRIEITPASVELRPGERVTFKAQGYDAHGNPITVRPFWHMAGDMGTISSITGTFVAKEAGVGYVVTFAQAVFGDTKTSVEGSAKVVVRASFPASYALSQNVPNPFNPTTEIRYQLPAASHVELAIYDLLGRKVQVLMDGFVEAGYRSVVWDAKDVASGIYFIRMEAGDFVKVRKMVVLR